MAIPRDTREQAPLAPPASAPQDQWLAHLKAGTSLSHLPAESRIVNGGNLPAFSQDPVLGALLCARDKPGCFPCNALFNSHIKLVP